MGETLEEIRLREVAAVWESGEARKEAFRQLTAEAAEACDRPIALFSIIDRQYQWVKAQVGMPKMRLARSAGFCQHTMMSAGLFEIEDLSKNNLTKDNPLVTGRPHLRSYAGVPILSPAGLPLGALCVIGLTPAALSSAQKVKLTEISQRLMAALDPAAQAARRERLQPNRAFLPEILKLAVQHASFPAARPKFALGKIVLNELLCDEYGMAYELSKIFSRLAGEGATNLTLNSEVAEGMVTVAIGVGESVPAQKLHLRAHPLGTAAGLAAS